MFGRNITLPIDIMMGPVPKDGMDYACQVEYVEELRGSMESSFHFVRQHLQQSAERQKKYYDNKAENRSFKEGDWVLRYYLPNQKDKLNPKYIGPYKVCSKINEINYKIQKSPNSPTIIVHIDCLKRYEFEEEEGPQAKFD